MGAEQLSICLRCHGDWFTDSAMSLWKPVIMLQLLPEAAVNEDVLYCVNPSVDKCRQYTLDAVPGVVFLPAKTPVYRKRSVQDKMEDHFGLFARQVGSGHEGRDNFVALMFGDPVDDMVTYGRIHKKAVVTMRVRDALAGRQNSLLICDIGARNQMIKALLMKMVAEHPSWHYVTLNMPGEIYIPAQIADRSLAVPGNIANSFASIKEMH